MPERGVWLGSANQRRGCGSGGVAAVSDGGVRALGRVRGRRAYGRGTRQGAAAGREGPSQQHPGQCSLGQKPGCLAGVGLPDHTLQPGGGAQEHPGLPGHQTPHPAGCPGGDPSCRGLPPHRRVTGGWCHHPDTAAGETSPFPSLPFSFFSFSPSLPFLLLPFLLLSSFSSPFFFLLLLLLFLLFNLLLFSFLFPHSHPYLPSPPFPSLILLLPFSSFSSFSFSSSHSPLPPFLLLLLLHLHPGLCRTHCCGLVPTRLHLQLPPRAPHFSASPMCDTHRCLRHPWVFCRAGTPSPIPIFSQLLPPWTKVLRIMPNLPCVVQAGAMVFSRGSNAGDEEAALLKSLLSSCGLCEEVPESYIDIHTGLSGSGVAYVYLFAEALAEGAVKMGMPGALASRIAAQTLLGAAKMLLETGEHPAKLRGDICTPGGTTIYALHQLEKGALRATVMDAVEAATNRACDMAKD